MYFKEVGDFKVLSKEVDKNAGRISKRDDTARRKRRYSISSQQNIENERTTRSNDEISNFNSTRTDKRSRSNTSSTENIRNVENSNKSSFSLPQKEEKNNIKYSLLTEEDYKRRQRNIDRKNVDNFEILKENIEDEDMALNISNILEEITKMRHEIHTNDDMFNSESYSGEEQSKFIDEINAKLEELGLEKMDLPDITDIPTDIDVYELDADYDETYEEFLNLKDKINKNIEKWLKEFDKKYGTHYAPTGAWRYLQNNEGKWQEFLDKHSINKGTRNTIKEVKLPISEKEFNARKNIENNSDLQYNNTERESDINVNEQRRDLERDTSESRLFEKRKQQQLKENKYREWEKSITSKAENELTNEERKLIQGVKNNYNKDIIFIKSDNAKGYYAGTSLDNSRIIYINTEKANKFGLKRTALHETMESNIRFSDTATKDIIISTIDDIINDDTFINQKMEFWNNQDGQMPSDTAIAKDIICDRFAELQGEEIDYTNVLSDELKNRIDLAIEFFQKQSRSNENSTQSSFLVPQDNLQHENNINSTAKAQNYEKRQNSKFKRQMSEFLGVSRFTKNNKTILDNVITQLRNEYNSNGKISENTRNIIFKDMYNNLVKEDSNYYNEYKDLKNEIEGTEINISTQIKKDITN